jgi:hypothetical protein
MPGTKFRQHMRMMRKAVAHVLNPPVEARVVSRLGALTKKVGSLWLIDQLCADGADAIFTMKAPPEISILQKYFQFES